MFTAIGFVLFAIMLLAFVGLFVDWKKASKALAAVTATAARDAAALFNTCAELAGLQKMLAEAAASIQRLKLELHAAQNAPALLESQFEAASDAIEAANDTIKSRDFEIYNLKESLKQRKEAQAELAAELEKVRGFQIKAIEFEVLQAELARVRAANDAMIESNLRGVPEMKASIPDGYEFDIQRRFVKAIDERAEAFRQLDEELGHALKEKEERDELKRKLAKSDNDRIEAYRLLGDERRKLSVTESTLRETRAARDRRSEELEAVKTEAKITISQKDAKIEELDQLFERAAKGRDELDRLLSERDGELSTIREKLGRIMNAGMLSSPATSAGMRFELVEFGVLESATRERNDIERAWNERGEMLDEANAKLTEINAVIASDTDKLSDAQRDARTAREALANVEGRVITYERRVPGIEDKVLGPKNFGGRWRLVVTVKPDGNRPRRKAARTITPASARRRGAGVTPNMVRDAMRAVTKAGKKGGRA